MTSLLFQKESFAINNGKQGLGTFYECIILWTCQLALCYREEGDGGEPGLQAYITSWKVKHLRRLIRQAVSFCHWVTAKSLLAEELLQSYHLLSEVWWNCFTYKCYQQLVSSCHLREMEVKMWKFKKWIVYFWIFVCNIKNTVFWFFITWCYWWLLTIFYYLMLLMIIVTATD